MPIDECAAGCANLPGDYRLPQGCDIVAVNPQVLSAQMRATQPDEFEPRNVCASEPATLPDMQEPRPSDEGLPPGGLGRRQLCADLCQGHGVGPGRGTGPPTQSGWPPPPPPRERKPRPAPTSTSTAAASSTADGLTEEERAFIQETKSYELGLNIAASTHSRMRTWCWKKFVWMVRVKLAVEKEGDRRWRRNPRWLAQLLGKEVAALWGHFGSMRQRMHSSDMAKLM